MPMEQIWNPTMTELMSLFRESLVTLLPVMEKAHIPWQEVQAYDDWDRIATSLFESVVVSSVRWGLTPGETTDLEVSAYDVAYPDYGKLSFIECVSDSAGSDKYLLFHKFVTNEVPFDMIRCYQVDSRGQKLTSASEIRPFVGARFALRLRRSPAQLACYERLAIRVAGRD